MLNRLIAESLMGIIPQKLPATLTLAPDTDAPTTVNITSAWFKPLDVRMTVYGGVNLQGDETRIKIPDRELNPSNNGRQIRPRDTIVMEGNTFNVLTARLMTVRTVWECLVRKEIG